MPIAEESFTARGTPATQLGHNDGTVGTPPQHAETMTTKRLAGALTLILLTAACSATSTSDGSDSSAKPGSSGPGRVVLIGDSVAEGLSLPLREAFASDDVEFQSLASDGGGAVVGPVSGEVWKSLPKDIAKADPDTVIYQITTYDWGTEKEQEAGYRRLLSTVTDAGANLMIVTMPPIKADDFYRPHLKELKHTTRAARAVAEASGGKAVVLDASSVWGDTYQQTKDGKADRSSDGIHTCPQGAARFTRWMLAEMAKTYPDFTPPSATEWANTGWAGDKRFIGC